MENLKATAASSPPSPNFKSYTGSFLGEGFELFFTLLGNAILTVLTLGIYAAWGRVKVYQFFYSNTEFAGHRFRFTGTGKEIFIGFLKAIGIIILIYLVFMLLTTSAMQIDPNLFPIIIIGFYLFIIYLFHYAIYSSLRYRFSRSRYREIRFQLIGKPQEFAWDAFKNFLLAVLTLGIFAPYYMHRKFSYIYNRLHFGNLPFQYKGDEKEFFKIVFFGFLLTVITFGIYFFWWYPKMYNYYVCHLEAGGGKFRAEIQPGEFFELLFTNLLIIVFTLGIGFAWVQVRTMKFYIEHLHLEGELDLDNVVQVIQEKVTATGEGLAEALDMDIGLGF